MLTLLEKRLRFYFFDSPIARITHILLRYLLKATSFFKTTYYLLVNKSKAPSRYKLGVFLNFSTKHRYMGVPIKVKNWGASHFGRFIL